MTAHKHLKQLIRARMEKTGERYAAARRQVIGSTGAAQQAGAESHFPGNVAATTALRILLTHAGVRAPNGAPFTEAMLFGIAGGIGIGQYSFYYEKADHASFYIAGRHQWHDDLAYLKDALTAFGIQPVVRETSGAKAAEKQLSEAVAGQRPTIAWVDMASLPHRGMPEDMRGGAYHVITVYGVDPRKGEALMGDMTDHPIEIPLPDLQAARAQIKKQKFRLLSIETPGAAQPDLRTLVAGGLQRCHHRLLHPSLPQGPGNARLEILKTWADRLHGSKDKERWERIFRPGANLWRGLNFVYTFIESYGTGGGLCRPLFAESLEEAAAAARWPELRGLAQRYAELGRQWSDLADDALPDDVPAFRAAKELRWRLAELRHAGAPAEESREIWRKLGEMEQQAAASFPLSADGCARLLAGLQARVLSLYEGETAALKELAKALDLDEPRSAAARSTR